MKKLTKGFMLLVCVLLFSLFALGSGSSDSEPQKVGEVTAVPVDTASNEKEETKKEETKADETKPVATAVPEEKIKAEYYVGETFTKGGFGITYVSSGEYISDNMFIQPADGNRFIKLSFHADNQSGSDKSVSSFEFKCYADGYDCSSHYLDDDFSASLSNGRSADGSVCFEVPVNAKEIEIEYEYDWINSKKVKFIYEGEKASGLVFEKNTSASETAFHVGDIIETKSLRISYVKAAEYVSDNMFLKPSEGKKYGYIELEVENISDSDQYISSFEFKCYADGSACDGYYGLDNDLSATLSAGRKAKGTVAFEIPVNAEIVEIEYEMNYWTEKKIIFAYEEK